MRTDQGMGRNGLYMKFFSLFNAFKMALFYRHIFALSDYLKGVLIYFCYYFSTKRINFNPITINLLITYNCNLNCRICSIKTGIHSSDNVLSKEDFEKFFSRQARYKPIIYFSGGEPFSRRDLIDILKIAKKYKLRCGINTNAYMLDSIRAQQLINLNIDLLAFSLYGPQAIHDRVTGLEGSYAQSIQNMIFFCKHRKRKTEVILTCTINKYNIDCLEEVPLIGRKIGVDAVKFEHLNFLSPDEVKNNQGYFSGKEDSINAFIDDFSEPDRLFAQKLIAKLALIKKQYGKYIFIKPEISNEEIVGWYSNVFNPRERCFFIWHSVFIKPDGTVVPCQFLLDYELGNIRDMDLRDILRSKKAVQLRALLSKQTVPFCSRCCKL